MPGTIKVSVLEAVDLPEVLTDGTIGKDVTAKVTLGPRLFKTQPGVADGGKIASWNSDFAFPVMNLRDKLVISICDSEDHSVTQTAIEIPSIIQKGLRDEFVALNKGGRIHLRMRFVLTEEERKKIEIMRVAALKRKEEAELLKKTVIMQPVTPKKELKKSPVSTVAITEVDMSTTGDKKDLKEPANGSLDDRKDSTMLDDKKDSTVLDDKKDSTVLGDKKDSTILGDKTDSTMLGDRKDATTLGDRKDATTLGDRKDATTLGDKKDATKLGDKKNSTLKRPTPKPMFNYAKAIGAPPSAKKTVKKLSAAVSDSSTNELKADNGDVSAGVHTVRESAKDAGEVVSSETTKIDASIEAPSSGDGAAPLVTKAIDSTPQGSLIPAGESDNVNNEVQANNADVKSEVQSGRESAKIAELGNTTLDGAALLETKPADSVAQANPHPTEVEPGVPENSTNEAWEADKDGMDSEALSVRGSAESSEEVRLSGNSKLDSSAVDASPSSKHESASLMIVSTDSASGEHLPLSIRSSSSGPFTLKTVKAKIKRTLSKVSSRRSSNRVSSSNSLSRTPPPVPVVWVHERFRETTMQESGARARLYNHDRPL